MSNSLKARCLSATLVVILVVLLFKLALTMGQYFSKGVLQLPTAEVMAGDRKVKPAEPPPAAPAKEQPAAKPASQPDPLVALQKREADVRQKEAELAKKEEYLTNMEKEVEQKLKDLTGIQKEIQAYRAQKEETQSAKVRSLAKIYGTMKPKEAAKLMENLDDQLVMTIIATMNSDEAAGILSNMDVKKAAKISEALSGR